MVVLLAVAGVVVPTYASEVTEPVIILLQLCTCRIHCNGSVYDGVGGSCSHS
jgi:hypothetical protein